MKAPQSPSYICVQKEYERKKSHSDRIAMSAALWSKRNTWKQRHSAAESDAKGARAPVH